METIRIGHISGPHGLNGLLKVSVITDVESRFEEGSEVLLGDDLRPYTIASFSVHKPRVAIVRLQGIDTREDSERISGCDIFLSKEIAEATRDDLDDGEFYYFDLVGRDVFSGGTKIAVVDSVAEGGSGHLLKIKTDEGDIFYIPFVDSIVDTARLKEGRIDINPPDGLLEK